MYERILVPLDGSKAGEAALVCVEELVSKLSPKVEVTLLWVVSSTHWVVAGEAGVAISYTEQELELIKRKAIDYLDKAGENLKKKGAIVKTQVSIGDAVEEIIKAADEIDASVIAISTHGRSGISRWAFGSVTDKVLRSGHRCVMTVRAQKS